MRRNFNVALADVLYGVVVFPAWSTDSKGPGYLVVHPSSHTAAYNDSEVLALGLVSALVREKEHPSAELIVLE